MRVLLAVAIAAASASPGEAEPDGKALFTGGATPPCAICHTLADAGSSGEIGPNLDTLSPTAEQVRAAVTTGVGVMPPYGEILDEAAIEALATYVSSVAGAS